MIEKDESYFGNYGGMFVPETLMPQLYELDMEYKIALTDDDFLRELQWYNKNYGGRPTPLYHARRLSEHLGGDFRVFLKREDLVHGGAHKFNNVIGQGLLAKRMGKTKIIAETGAGQHGLATAMASAVLGLDATIYMGEKDIIRQKQNVMKMEAMGAKVIPVTHGSKTLKDAVNEALRKWVTDPKNTYYLIGSVVGPYPYPMIVRDFQSIIGKEIKNQYHEFSQKENPDILVACVGGGSNAIGTFYPFLKEKDVRMIGVEAGGDDRGNGASLTFGTPGYLHGSRTYLLQDENGNILESRSISAGLDYPAAGPEHSFLKDDKRVEYIAVNDRNAVNAYLALSKLEGIIPALESSHALSWVINTKENLSGKDIVITLSGRGEKDMASVNSFLEGNID